MKRRDFVSFAGAALSAPMIPSMATASVVTPVASSTGQFALASHLAKYNPQISAANLVRTLKVPAATAHQIMGQMIRQGVVVQAGTAGAKLASNLPEMSKDLDQVWDAAGKNSAEEEAEADDKIEPLAGEESEN